MQGNKQLDFWRRFALTKPSVIWTLCNILRVDMDYTKLIVVAAITLASVSCSNNCVEMGDKPFANISKIGELAERMELTVKPHESAFIVGAALANSQVEDEQVQACLRLGGENEVEFSIRSMSGKLLQNWTSVPGPTVPPNA